MLEKMIEYQNEETSVIKLESELAKSTARENASKIQQILKNQQSELISLENEAKKTNETFDLIQKKYNEYMSKLEAFEKEIENADPEKSANYEKMYKDFAAIGANLEKDIKKIYEEVKAISEKYEETIQKSKKFRGDFDKNIAVYKKQKAENEPKIEMFKENMKKLEKEINSKIFQVYKQKRDSHIFPVFVKLIDNKKCGGCRMDISASKLEQMKTNELGIIECENCNRLIYQE